MEKEVDRECGRKREEEREAKCVSSASGARVRGRREWQEQH